MAEIHERDIRDFSFESMMTYNQSVITDRALPNVYDGLKPVQRRILFGSHVGKYNSNKKYVKSARIVGDVIGSLSPHGDSSTYDAAVNLLKDYTNNQPLLDGHGSFASVLGDTSAAMRYSSMRLNKFSEQYLLDGVDNNVVDMMPTFDSEGMEPVVLPAKLPMILINGVTGIGAGGFASSLPAHSIKDVVNSTVALLKNSDITTKELINKYHLKPSFPFGGQVNISDIEKIYTTGEGTFTTRAIIEKDTDSDKKSDLLIIKELPYGVTLGSIKEKIKEIHNDNKLKREDKFIGLKDLQDKSHRGDVELVLFYTKGTNLDLAIKQLYSRTNLQSFVSFNPNMIKDEDTLVEYTDIKDILTDWISFRKKTVKRDKMNKIREIEKRIHILNAIILVFRSQENTDRFIEVVREGDNRNDIYETLKSEFDLNNVQSEYLTNLRLYNINQFESTKYEDELEAKQEEADSEIKYLRVTKL